jgi:hypothetical protein|tara:strand:- start:165 stop:1103 length:939 start_codon:yes stop_codon:yes gene_type:complete
MTQEYLNRADASIRETILEVNFREKLSVRNNFTAAKISDDVWDEKVLPKLNPFWHIEGKDEIEYFIYYSDNSYLCQKRRLRTDPDTNSQYWKTYWYEDATSEQAYEVYELFSALFTLTKEERRTNWVAESKKLFDHQFYYEGKWRKMRGQISEMLLYSDWRMLPDYEEEFEGELALWKEWRKRVRNLLPDLETFESAYAAFEFVSKMKYPLDPNMYVKKYPNRDVEYLSTDDQFDKLDFKASSDFVAANVANIGDFVRNYAQEDIIVTQKAYALMEELSLFEYFPDLEKSLVKPEANNRPEDYINPTTDGLQ